MNDFDAPVSAVAPRPHAGRTAVDALGRENAGAAPSAAKDSPAPDHHRDDDHEHPAFNLLTGVRIAYAVFCVAALWFVEAFFFLPGTLGESIHEFFVGFEIPTTADLIGGLGSVIPSDWLMWADDNLLFPFSVYGYSCILFSGWPILKAAIEDLIKLRMTMELSMTIAIAAGAFTGYFFVVAMVIFFVLIAEVLEGLTVGRGRRAIRELLEFLPHRVTVRRDGAPREIDVADLKVGETVLVAPGERIPVDGIVGGGNSFVDESRITGESMPVEKVADAQVYAGSINQSGVLEVRADRIGADTSYGKIIEAVERAEHSRAPIARTSDRLAGWIVLFAIGFAIATQLAWHDVSTSISVLVVAGACGVAAGTPLAILGAIGRTARMGAIVKGGSYLQMLYRVDTVVFDKTGTLTFGEPRVTSVTPASGVSREQILAAAAGAEIRSEHPLGKAIVDQARAAHVAVAEPADFRYTPGRGIAAAVGGARVLVGSEAWLSENGVIVTGLTASPDAAATRVYVARDGKLLGEIAVADTVRPEARRAMEGLRRRGLRTILLTGDNRLVAEAIARDLGITEVEANLLPEQKVARVRELVAAARTVAMVGDGVNDAPALAEASVGVAMGSGTDVARESADIVLLGNDLAKFVDMIDVAYWTRRIIYQNFVGTVLVDILGVLAALAGIIGPVIAIQIHTISELIFISNSARLLPRKWDPFRAWRELYNSWNLIAQWGAGIMIGAALTSLAGYLYTLRDPTEVVNGPLGPVSNHAHNFAELAIGLGGAAFLAGVVVMVVGLLLQRSERLPAPAE